MALTKIEIDLPTVICAVCQAEAPSELIKLGIDGLFRAMPPEGWVSTRCPDCVAAAEEALDKRRKLKADPTNPA